ncbi:hypothetical protein [Desulfovibrio sp. SGI.169]|uniref:hypothetical protein n=1 Tax=Desulfovibrio sp. SGI.169 TaxID=3420561 RepID=UPI003D070AEE
MEEAVASRTQNGFFRAGRVTVRFLSVMYMNTLPPKNRHFPVSAKNYCGDSPRPSPRFGRRAEESPFLPTNKSHKVLLFSFSWAIYPLCAVMPA